VAGGFGELRRFAVLDDDPGVQGLVAVGEGIEGPVGPSGREQLRRESRSAGVVRPLL